MLAANAALLQWDPSAAESILEAASHRGNTSLLILNDLAVAYAMDADHTRSNRDYAKALAATDQVLSQSGSDPTALFNRVLILERMGQRNEAIATVKFLLKVEHDPAWTKEAADQLRLLE